MYGLPGLYKGWLVTMMRDVPYTSLQFTFYETIKRLLEKDKKLSVNQEMIAGCFAGMAAGAITTPLDVLKTFLQTQKVNREVFVTLNGEEHYSYMRSALRKIYSSSGILGFMSGIGPRVMWTGSQSMIMFVLYENFVSLLKSNQFTVTL